MSRIMYIKDVLEDITTKVMLCGVVIMLILLAVTVVFPSTVLVCPVVALAVMLVCLGVMAVKEITDLIVSIKGGETEVERRLAE